MFAALANVSAKTFSQNINIHQSHTTVDKSTKADQETKWIQLPV